MPPDTGPGRKLRVPDPGSLDGATDVTIVDVAANGYRLRLVDAPEAFDRDGFYGPPGGGDFADNAHRFGLLCRAALEVLRLETDRPVDVIHLHDWHSCPAAVYRDRPFGDDPVLKRAAIVLTLHNLAYHGWTPAEDLSRLASASVVSDFCGEGRLGLRCEMAISGGLNVYGVLDSTATANLPQPSGRCQTNFRGLPNLRVASR